MNELLEKGQIISIVPQDFRNSNKGEILDIKDRSFTLNMQHAPEGIIEKRVMEFYSATKNGTLYFTSHIMNVNDNSVEIAIPRKHRFLQRRTFTRVKITQDIELQLGENKYKATSSDLSAGGLKFKTDASLSLDSEYDLTLNLINNEFKCKYQPIKIEKGEDGLYTLAGRFNNLTKADKMKIVQFCIRKDIENKNR